MMEIGKTASSFFLSITVVLLSGCCSTDTAQQSWSPLMPALADTSLARPESGDIMPQTIDNAIIGHLKTKDKIITIQTGRNGPLYTVKTKEGNVLEVDLTKSEISAKFPELEELVNRGLANLDAWADLELMGVEHN